MRKKPTANHKSTGGGDILIFACISVCLYNIFICFSPPDQTKNDTDLKIGTHTVLDHI